MRGGKLTFWLGEDAVRRLGGDRRVGSLLEQGKLKKWEARERRVTFPLDEVVW